MGKIRRGPAAVWFKQRPALRLGVTLVLAGGLLGRPALLAARVAPSTNGAARSIYDRALRSFRAGDYQQTLTLLEDAADGSNSQKSAADVANLRGAAQLKLQRYRQAEESFASAAKLDPHLWEARFNAAEVAFRREDYNESARQFQSLLEDAGPLGHQQERELVRYKALLSQLLAGRPGPAAEYVREHAGERRAPLARYYLQAALDYREGRSDEAATALIDAQALYPLAASRWYLASFQELGWSVPHSDSMVAGRPGIPGSGSALSVANERRTTLAAVQLMPRNAAPPAASSKKTASTASKKAVPPNLDAEDNMPPDPDVAVALDLRSPEVPGGPRVLAKPGSATRKGKATPTPSPSATPSSSPAAADASPTPDSEAGTPGGELPSANATPVPSPSAAFIQAYEAAYVQFLGEKYDEARELLDKADSIQKGQPDSVRLRAQMFKHFYSEAYLQYAARDFKAAMTLLDSADKVLPDQADTYNMRGLIYSRERIYGDAEAMFKKAIALDPTFWEAKFNQAELPFIRNNYTEARARFENLLAQTDPAKLPKEAELTEFKVFLTLLLEGKEPAARSMMQHFNFSGTTPARYYCQAALDFYHGDQDKALSWVSSARKEYPAKLEGIFAQAFYRVGWFSDSSPAAIAAATPAADAAAAGMGPVTASTPGSSAGPVVASVGSPAPDASPAASASPSPAVLAMASPAKEADLATATPTPTPKPTPSPAQVTLATPAPTPKATPSPTQAVAAASPAATRRPAPSIPPAVVIAASPEPTLIAAAPPLAPGNTTPAVVVPGSSPAQTPASSAASASVSPVASPSPEAPSAPSESPSATVESTPTPEASASSTGETVTEEGLTGGQLCILILVGLAIIQTLITAVVFVVALKRKKARLAKKPLRYSGQTHAKN